ncbi:MAG TPA: hypothetical protein VGO66_05710 [Solirubrobacterales bacterium]|jgi:hypothetical protein|nr:hypothetical protein [Solirubrobacterales bacterium]
MRTSRRLGFVPAVCCVAVAAACAVASPAAAATSVYPAGGSTFTGGAQGWEATEASCNVPLLCTASGGYDGTAGNPPGAIAANTTIALNLLTLFKSTVTLRSPDFTVSGVGDGTLHLDRQFAAGSLIDLAPQATYTVTLLDRTSGTKSEPLTESLTSNPAFIGKDHAVSLKQGHRYAIAIVTETSSTVAGTGLLSGTTSLRFDNVSVSVESSTGNGGGGTGAGGLSNSELASLIKGGTLVGPAVLRGNKVTVKARCPAKIGRACRISVQGMLNKRKAATTKRNAKVAKGKARKFVLKVKPKARKKVAKAKRLLFKETVKAGKAKATVYKRLKLVRKGG